MNEQNNPVKAADTTVAKVSAGKAGKEYGRSGTVMHGGIIVGEEYNSNLHGQNAIRIYDTMRRSDATVRAMLQVVKLPIQTTEWSMQSASDEVADIYVSNFITRELFDRNISFPQLLNQALGMCDFGFAVFEKVLELCNYEGNPQIGILKLGSRKQNSIYKWIMDSTGKEGITQRLRGGYDMNVVEIPREKLIIFTHDKEGDNYEGISMLRYAYKHWDIKDKLDLVNAIALEKLAIGFPVLKAPDGADPNDIELAEAALVEMRANESSFMRIPVGWELEMMDMKAGTTKDVLPTIAYHDLQIVKSVLAQFLELGSNGSGGSHALSSDQTKLFEKSLEAMADTIRATLQKELIEQLCDLNFSNLPNGYPQLRFGKIGDDKLVEMADSIQKLTSAQVLTPDAKIEAHLRNMYGLPDMPDEYKDDYANRPLANMAIPPLATTTELTPVTKPEPTKASAIADAQKARKILVNFIED